MQTVFGAAFDTHGSDKSSHHGYDRFYARHLGHLREVTFNLLEVGYAQGASARAWLDIFPNAHVIALDINPQADDPHRSSRCTVLTGDQNDPATLDMVIDRIRRADVIIDDGSHVPSHQLKAFNAWFVDLLAPGGVYVIEDIETSYWVRGALYGNAIACGIGHPENIVDIFKNVVHGSVNREFAADRSGPPPNSPIRADAHALISSITFGYNCIIVHKKTQAEHAVFDGRVYRFAQFV
jgi:hypothetical protein